MKPGDVIGDRFEIERYVAGGGMGTVYRAIDRHTDAPAAVKHVRAADAASVERFAREARALAELRHPGIVAYLDHGRTGDGELFLAMEWLEGEDLGARLATHELSVDEALAVVTGAAAALAVAHAREIVHRDVKPSNLFLVDWRPEKVKLLDFGVARLERLARLTATGHMVGTPLYMAPEQMRGETVDARADVFALGAVLFRCLAGQAAFRGQTAAELLFAVGSRDEAPRVASLAPHVPPAIDDLCARMLRKDPAGRPRDAAAVLGELIGFDPTALGATPSRPRRTELGEREARLVCVAGVARPLDEQLLALATTEGGLAERSADGTVVVYFEEGGALATDQAQQAARFAVAARAATGAAVALALGRGRARVSAGAGAALAVTPPGTIRIDPAVAGLLGARFDIAGDEGGLALTGEHTGADKPRPLLGEETAFVGRDRELALLESSFADCVANGVARAVLVTAPAGTGKSRLRQELARRLRAGGQEVELLAGFGDPMRAGAPLGLLGEAVRRAAGIDGHEPLEERRERLRRAVAAVLPAAEAGHVSELLGELAGVPFDAAGSAELRAARRDVALLAEQIRAAWLEWLGAVCRRRPVVLVLEDLHWGDLPTVKLVDAALQALAEQPLLVLGLARPEVHDLFPRLWAERGLQEMHLGSLPRRAAERLVAAALPDASGDVITAIVDRAGGNAFYLEELIRHVAEGRPGDFPDSVLAMAAARFDRLSADGRRVLRAASVFGEVFWAGGVAALLGAERAAVAGGLAELTARELVQPRRQSRLAAEAELAFRHSLLREAAYALLTDEDRVLGHRLAGAWLEQAGEGEALVLAEHLERGGERPRAAVFYARAAEHALAGNDAAAALAHAGRGLACEPSTADAGALHLIIATVHKINGDMPAARDAGIRAMALLDPGSEPWYAAAAEAAAAAGKLFERAELRGLVDQMRQRLGEGEVTPAQATALARAAAQAYICGDVELGELAIAPLDPLPPHLEREPAVRAWIEEALAFRTGFVMRDSERSLRHTQEAARLSELARDPRTAVLQRIHASFLMMVLGFEEEAVEQLFAEVAHAERLRMPIAARSARIYLAIALHAAHRLEEGLEVIDRVDTTDASAHPRVICLALAVRGNILNNLGRVAEAEIVLRRALALGEPAKPNLVFTASLLAGLLARQGRAAEALEAAKHIDLERYDAGSGVWACAFAHGAMIETLRAAGRLDEARRVARAGRALIDEDLGRIRDPERRARARRHRLIAEYLALADEVD